MRKSMKKLIALTLACLMLATLFVGCGKKDDGGSSGGDTIKLGWMGSLTGRPGRLRHLRKPDPQDDGRRPQRQRRTALASRSS